MPLLQAGMRHRWELKKDASHRRGDQNPLHFFVKKLDRTNVRFPLRAKAPQVWVCAGCTKIINIFQLFCAIRKIPKKIKKNVKKLLTFGMLYAILITERKERGNKNDKERD